MNLTAKLLARDVVTVSGSATVREAAEIMKRHGIGCVVVAEEGRLAGIFTERDVLNRVVAEGVDPERALVSGHMTTSTVSLDVAEPLEKVFEILSRRRFRHLPITENGRLAGIISLTDLAGVLREVFLEEKYLRYFVSYLEGNRKPAPSHG